MSTKRHGYKYAVLRYVHDVVAQEFLNVGVVLSSCSAGVLKAKVAPTLSRVKLAFPGVDDKLLRVALGKLQDSLNTASGELDLAELLAKLLPDDESSLQFSTLGAGVTSDVDQAFEELTARFLKRDSIWAASVYFANSDAHRSWHPDKLIQLARPSNDPWHEGARRLEA